MSVDLDVETEDLTHLLELLREYTTKLRELCAEQYTVRIRMLQSATVVTIVASTAAGALATWLVGARVSLGDWFLPLIILLGGMAAVVYLATITASTSSRFRLVYDSKHVASTVEKLIKSASQLSEHANKRISDKFEFDLRVAEAEAALQTYKATFDRRVE